MFDSMSRENIQCRHMAFFNPINKIRTLTTSNFGMYIILYSLQYYWPVLVMMTWSRLADELICSRALPDKIPWGAIAYTFCAPCSFRKPASKHHGSTSSIISSNIIAICKIMTISPKLTLIWEITYQRMIKYVLQITTTDRGNRASLWQYEAIFKDDTLPLTDPTRESEGLIFCWYGGMGVGKLQAKVGTIGRFPLPITIGVGGGDVLPSTSLCEEKVVSIVSTLLNSTTA